MRTYYQPNAAANRVRVCPLDEVLLLTNGLYATYLLKNNVHARLSADFALLSCAISVLPVSRSGRRALFDVLLSTPGVRTYYAAYVVPTRVTTNGIFFVLVYVHKKQWKYKVSIPRLEVEGVRTAANVLTDRSSTTSTTSTTSITSKSSSGTDGSDAGFAAAATIAAGAPPRTAHGGGQGTAAVVARVRAGPAFVGNGGRGEIAALRIAPSPRQPQPHKIECPVETRVTEAGNKVYAFSKDTPARHGRWSRMEEEFAKRYDERQAGKHGPGEGWVGRE